MKQIIINEWKSILKTRSFLIITILFGLSLLAITYWEIKQNQFLTVQQQQAHQHMRDQWEAIDNVNPHTASHYGTYAFKPTTLLSSIDNGINAITGNVIRLESHVQNETAYSENSQSISQSKFGKLSPSLLLQFIIPLFLIFIAFSSISQERETGRIKLLLIQGITIPRLIFAKSLSIWFYGFALLSITFISQLILHNNQNTPDYIQRLFLLILIYSSYYYIIISITVYLSARFRNNTSALTLTLSIWLLWCVFLPRISGNTIEYIYPLPSRQDFKTAMLEDRLQGIDGHNPHDKRGKALTNKTLLEYGVATVDELPINFDGLRMQTDEDYGNSVWDKHFGSNNRLLKDQKIAYQFSGFFNPFAALQDASMGFAGSDLLHYIDFQLQVEQYRRFLVKTLNEKQTYGGSKTGDWKWKEDHHFYKSIADFKYQQPSITKQIPNYLIDLISMGFWILLSTVLVIYGSKKINVL